MLRKLYGMKPDEGNMNTEGVDCQQKERADVSFDEKRELSKRKIETFEHWSRRLINDFFRNEYGDNYLNAMVSPKQPLIKAAIKKQILDRKGKDPSRYPRDIDAILLEDIKYFLTREDLYSKFFKQVLEPFFSRREEVRRLLDCLISIRNKLYHDNLISFREAEQAACYTNDFIDAYKKYYIQAGKEQEFNVPVILSLSDSQGNRLFRNNNKYRWEILNIRPDSIEHDVIRNSIYTTHRSGDHYEIVLEIDSSFPSDSYQIKWELLCADKAKVSGSGNIISFDFTDEMVAFVPEIKVELTTNKRWHRFAYIGCDDAVTITLSTVLPPIEDTY